MAMSCAISEPKVMRERSSASPALFLRELSQVTVRVRAASKFVEARSTEGAVRGIPPDEVSDGCRGGKHYAKRKEKERYSTSHGKAKYSMGTIEPRRAKLRAAPLATMLLTNSEDVAAAVCAADGAGMMRGPRAAALRANYQVRD